MKQNKGYFSWWNFL